MGPYATVLKSCCFYLCDITYTEEPAIVDIQQHEKWTEAMVLAHVVDCVSCIIACVHFMRFYPE